MLPEQPLESTPGEVIPSLPDQPMIVVAVAKAKILENTTTNEAA